GGRSANRGQCAQACRLPYSLVVDGAVRDLGEVEYLLSPKDLVGLDVVPQLADIGVASLKIEGRLKGPAYVATAVAQYRRAAALSVGEPALELPVDVPLDPESLHVAYSRGISSGFLQHADHQTLVEGRFPRHRGLPLGRVVEIDGDEVEVVDDPDQRPVTGGRGLDVDVRAADNTVRTPDSTVRTPDSTVRTPDNTVRLSDVRAGMGVVFDAGTPEQKEQGGPIFAVARTRHGHRLRFGEPGPDLSKVRVGDFVWVSSDPRVTRAGEKAAEAGRHPLGRIPIELAVSGKLGEPLLVRAHIVSRERSEARVGAGSSPRDRFDSGSDAAVTRQTQARSTSTLAQARAGGITRELLADKLGALGGTPFHLGALDTKELAAGLHLPVSELKEIRRAIVMALDAAVARVDRRVVSESVIESVRAKVIADYERSARAVHAPAPDADIAPQAPATNTSACATMANIEASIVVPLCRDDAQLDAVLDAGATEVELDWMELVGLGRAVERARARGARVTVATVRVQKPGEDKIDAHLARLDPDAVLVRSWGSLAYFEQLAREQAHDASRTHVDTADRMAADAVREPILHG
ncbi:MAG TPA: U32 family peptidase, partial [Kofleriaceae bacterium]